MKRTQINLFLLISLLLRCSYVRCQSGVEVKWPNISVSFPAGGDSLHGKWLSLGLMSNVAGLDGANVSLIGGVVQGDMNGLMLSGLTNVAKGRCEGVQIAALNNLAGRDSYGLMVSGLINATAGCAHGVQLSAVGNMALRTNGVQLSVISNVATESAKGLQVGGVINLAANADGAMQCSPLVNVCVDDMRGVQVGLGNYAGSLNGVQLGLLNLASKKRGGLQIGIINYSRDTTLHKIGLVNVTPGTDIQMMAFGGNTSKTNIAVRFKNRKTYNILGFGTHYLGLDDKFSGCLYYRSGLRLWRRSRWEVGGDAGFYHIENFDNEDSATPARMYSLQARMNIEVLLVRKVSVFASVGYSVTRFYEKNRKFENKPVWEMGIILF